MKHGTKDCAHQTTKESDPSELGTNEVSPTIAPASCLGLRHTEEKIQTEPAVPLNGGDGTRSLARPRQLEFTRQNTRSLGSESCRE